MSDVTVVIPTVPERKAMLDEAVDSVRKQTHECDLIVSMDVDHVPGKFTGTAGRTRNRAIEKIRTEWTAFLDDDDVMYPQHVEKCLACARAADADLVYPWFGGVQAGGVLIVTIAGRDVTPEGIAWCKELEQHLRMTDLGHQAGNYIPITVLVKTELLQRVGGFPEPDEHGEVPYDDEAWALWIKLLDAGARFAHLPERTWEWRIHGSHLSRLHFPARTT